MPINEKLNRRDFLKASRSGLTGLGCAFAVGTPSTLKAHPEPWLRRSSYVRLTEQVGVYTDAINVGLIHANGKVLLVDSGDGSILNAVERYRLGAVEWVLMTHYHRDQCAGLPLLLKAGVKIAVPADEASLFRRATEFWETADTHIDHRYDFRPEFNVLRSSVIPDRELSAGDVFGWEGLSIQVVATPGHTDGSLSYIAEIDGERIAFTGDLIYGPGQLWEFYSLQKALPGMKRGRTSGDGGYWGFGGAIPDLKQSLDKVAALRPSILVPSHGGVMRKPIEGIALLKENLDAAMDNFLTLTSWRVFDRARVDFGSGVATLPALPAPPAPPWLHRAEGTSWFIKADDGRIFLFDCGFSPVVAKIEQLINSRTISGVDAIWISHYHDDHVTSVNEVRRLYGAKVYAQAELQDILAFPRAYLMPCLYPESIRVDHPLVEGEVINWKEYKLTAYYFPGQTLFHGGLLVEHDHQRIFMSGDSFSNFGIDDYCIYNRNFLGEHEPGFQQCFRKLMMLQPDMLVAAHFGVLPFAQSDIEKAQSILLTRYALFRKLFPWDDPNFGLDPHWIRAYPYRQSLFRGQSFRIEVRIYNHSGVERRAWAELRVPEGWQACEAHSADIPPHSEGKIPLTGVMAEHPNGVRDVVGIVCGFDDHYLGEFQEAIVDYLG